MATEKVQENGKEAEISIIDNETEPEKPMAANESANESVTICQSQEPLINMVIVYYTYDRLTFFSHYYIC